MKENEVKERFAEIYDEAKERIENLIEDYMEDVDGVYLRFFGKKEVEVTISPSQLFFEYDGITIWLSDGMEEGFKKNFKRLIEIYYNIHDLNMVEVDGEEYWVDIASQRSFLTPVFVRDNGEVIEPKYDKEEDVLYWTLLTETEVDEWIDYYEFVNRVKTHILEVLKAFDTEGIPQKVDIDASIYYPKDLALFRTFIADKGYASVLDRGTLWVGTDEESIRKYLSDKAIAIQNFLDVQWSGKMVGVF